MKGLYRGRYLIVVLDKNGDVKNVYCQPTEYNGNVESFKSMVAKAFNGKTGRKDILFVDVLERHDDIFAEEDQAFIDFIKDTTKKSGKECSEELGISERSYFRKKEIFNNHENLL